MHSDQRWSGSVGSIRLKGQVQMKTYFNALWSDARDDVAEED